MKCNRETVSNFLMIILFLIVGIGLAIILKHFGSVNVPLQRTLINAKTLYDQELDAEHLKVKNEALNKKIEIDSARLQGYQAAESAVTDENTVISTIDEYFQVELEKYKMANGTLSMNGPGIVITVSDSDKAIEQGENPNKYLVHNADILAIINELKAAGAEGIQINKIRLVSTSNIDCGGAVINIDDEISSSPFIIEAIGDPESMFIYLNSDESVIQMLKYWEIKVNIEKADSLSLNKSNKE